MSSDTPTHPQQVIRFEYLQSLAWQAENRWSEQVEARVTLTDAAFSSGWLRQHFTGQKGGATDFVILIAIVMHARPLKGDDLQYLVNLGMATAADEGRLYARITDKGLADELGIHRTTVAKSANRLAEASFITILDIPEHLTSFRDSHGQFAGSKVYLLSGELEQFLPKALHARPTHRVALSDTDGDGLTATVTPENEATVSLEPTHRVSLTDTNKRLKDRGGEEVFKQIAPEIVFSHFAQLRGQDYVPNDKDRATLETLEAEGYATDEILAAMQRAAANLDGTLRVARTFAYVIPEIRRQPPENLGEASGSAPGDSNPGERNPFADSTSALPELSAVQIPADILQTIQQIIGRPLTGVERQRLAWLHAELQGEADDPVWPAILAAVKFQLNPQAQQPVAYLRKVLENQPAKPQKPSKDSSRPVTALAKQNPHATEHPPIQVGGLVLTRPKDRPSGYVVPAEENMRNLYEVAAWFLEQEKGNPHADPS
jgi:hypothetical protein